MLDPRGTNPVSFGQFHEVGSEVQVNVAVTFLKKDLLPLANHPQSAIIDDGDLDRNAVLHNGGEVVQGHLESAVAHDGDHLSIGKCHLRTHGRRDAIAHRTESAGREPGARAREFPELGAPHLVLAHVDRSDGILAGILRERLDHELRLDVVGVFIVGQRVLGTPDFNSLQPLLPFHRRRNVPALQGGKEGAQGFLGVAHQSQIGAHVLVDLGRVHVQMNLLSVGRSSKRAPTAMSKSHWVTAMLVA